jgi:hypothetical protein
LTVVSEELTAFIRAMMEAAGMSEISVGIY